MLNKFKITDKDYIIRMSVILLAALTPYICILGYGYLASLSLYWQTDIQPLFIIANVTTSYYLYSISKWKLSALMLLLLTAFSIDLYPLIHNILAGGFFILTIIPLLKSKHFRWTLWLYVSAIFFFFWSMLFAEIVAITALCTYHALVLRRIHRLTY